MIISLSELYFGLRRPILLVQTKELISMSMSCGSRKGSSKPWRFDLKFTLRDIHINSNLNSLTKFTSSSRSTKFKDSLSRNISQIIMKIVPISTRTETTTWSEFPTEGKPLYNKYYHQKKEKRSRTVGVRVNDSSRKTNHLSKVIWNYSRVQQSISSTRRGLASPCGGGERQTHQLMGWSREDHLCLIK